MHLVPLYLNERQLWLAPVKMHGSKSSNHSYVIWSYSFKPSTQLVEALCFMHIEWHRNGLSISYLLKIKDINSLLLFKPFEEKIFPKIDSLKDNDNIHSFFLEEPFPDKLVLSIQKAQARQSETLCPCPYLKIAWEISYWRSWEGQ